MKKEVKRKIKEDKFVDVINKAYDFAANRKKEISMVGVALVAIALIIVGVRVLQAGNVKKENRVLSEIIRLSEELKENPEKLADLEKLAGKGKFSRMAYLEIAEYWVEQKDYAKAEQALMELPESRQDLLYYQSRDMLAQVYAYEKKFDEALSIYDGMEKTSSDFSQDVILFHKAEILQKKGDADKALELYKKLQEEYSQTYFGYEASQKVRELEEKK